MSMAADGTKPCENCDDRIDYLRDDEGFIEVVYNTGSGYGESIYYHTDCAPEEIQ